MFCGMGLLAPLPSGCLPGARGRASGRTAPVRFCVPSTVSPHSHLSPRKLCVCCSQEPCHSLSLSITCILSSPLSFARVWSRQVDCGGGGHFSPMESEMTKARHPLLGVLWYIPWTCGQMGALLVGRCLLLQFTCLRLLVEHGLCGRVTFPLLVPIPRPGAKLFKNNKQNQ